MSTDKSRNIIRLATILSILLMVSCAVELPKLDISPGTGSVVDITDLFQTGQDSFQTFLAEDSLLSRTWRSRRTQVIMVLIDIQWDDGDLEQAQQSGIILRDGSLVLTAGHGFVIDDGEILEIKGRLPSGKEVGLVPLGFRYEKGQVPVEDWALLRTEKKLPYADFIPAAEKIERGKLMVLGYPATLGQTEDGEVVFVREANDSKILPLGLICSHHLLDRNTLFPQVGTIPLKGISGAPVFDSNGDLIGLFSSMGRRRNIEGWDYIFGMADIPWVTIESIPPK